MLASLSSPSSASVRVEKATSELLMGPDWTINIEICDSINSNHWDGKDIIKSLKKRLQHKNPKVQLLALTLLETLVKNCGDYVHFQIVEKNVLQEMIKITKKKADMRVRDKILVLLDSWQEAFGGPRGKYPQYYFAYEELRCSGVVFPQRSPDSVPIFTPPVAQSSARHIQAGYGMPSNSSSRLDQAMAADTGNLSLSSIDSMRNALDFLADMLRAVNPSDRSSVKDEVIVDLVNQCRSNQKKLMQMLATTGDEELLSQGLDLNDSLQNELAKHDAIASGSPLPPEASSFGSPSAVEPAEVKHETSVTTPTAPLIAASNGTQVEEDEEDDFALLARRHNKTKSTASEDTSTGTSESAASVNIPCNALALPDPPAPVRTSKEQDMVDLLSLALTTTTLSPETPLTPPSSSSSGLPPAASPTSQGLYSNASQGYQGNQGQVPFNGYVAPWAQPQTQNTTQFQPQQYSNPQQMQPQQYNNPQQMQPQQYNNSQQMQSQQYNNSQQMQPQPPSQPYPQSTSHLQTYPQNQPQYPQQSYGYPPPPWAPTPGYLTNQSRSTPIAPYTSSIQQAPSTPPTFRATQEAKPLQQFNSFPVRSSNNGQSLNGEPIVNTSSPTAQNVPGSKPFVPSYRLFEDLDVLGNNGNARFKAGGSPSSLSGASNPSMVGGRK